MKIEDVKKKQREDKKCIPLSIRTYPSYSRWLREHDVSPNAVFDNAVKELMKEK